MWDLSKTQILRQYLDVQMCHLNSRDSASLKFSLNSSSLRSNNSLKYFVSYLFPFIKRSSFKAKPFVIYSFKIFVAHILNSVAFLELILYPTAIIASKL